MLAASFDLMHEGQASGPSLLVLGVCLGALFIRIVQRKLAAYEDLKFQTLRGAGAKRVLLFSGVMAAHAFGEGIGVGVAYCG